jgi:allantoinase
MRPELRLRYAASVDRPRVELPKGKVALWPVVNVEHWLIDNPMPRQVLIAPTGAALLPDLPNWAWHEYGMRVGFWRLLDAFERRGVRPTLSINGSVCVEYARIANAAHAAGWEFMGHGFVQVPTHKVADQARMIADTLAAIRVTTGKPCTGWLGPGLTETAETPDLLAAAGIQWIADWVVDDKPCRLKTASGDVLTMPYSVELNDIPVQMIQHHAGPEFGARALATAKRLLAEAASPGPLGGAKVMSFAIHPYITGVPHRIDAFEAMLDALLSLDGIVPMQGDEIAKWYRECGDRA